MLLNIGRPPEIAKDCQYLIDQDWYAPSEIWTETRAADDWGRPVTLSLKVKRDNIGSAYSNIPFKIMTDFARKDGKIEINGDLETKANDILSDYPDLKTLDGMLTQCVASVGNDSKPEDWLKMDPFLSKIRHDHLNFSAKVKTGLTPRIKGGERERYIFKG